MKNILKTYKRLLSAIIKKDKKYKTAIILGIIAGALIPLASSLYPKYIIRVIQFGENKIRDILLISLIYFLFSGVFSYVFNYYQYTVKTSTTEYRLGLFRKVLDKFFDMPYKDVEHYKAYEKNSQAMDTLSGDFLGLEGILVQTIEILASVFSVFILTALIAVYNIWAALLIIIYIILAHNAQNKINDYISSLEPEKEAYKTQKRIYNRQMSSFKAMKDIRIYNLQDILKNKYYEVIEGVADILGRVMRKTVKSSILHNLLLLATLFYFFYTLLTDYVNKRIALENFIMYLTLSVQLLSVIDLTIANFAFFIEREMRGVEAYFKFQDTDFREHDGGKKAFPHKEKISIELRNIAFKYEEAEDFILKDINISIKGGQKVAIVGPNGAGKTTLVNIITGLYKPARGEVLLNGINIKDFDRDELHKMYSSVFQNICLYPFTIKENIVFGDADVSDEKIDDILKKAGLYKKVSSLTDKANTYLVKGVEENAVELSGGESQKLAIARAIYKDANIIIMDEPTSALDALSEKKIYEDLNDVSEEKTAIYISHRLSSTKFCDKIVLIEDGVVKEEGSHEELMARKGEYYNMFIIQGKYYQKEEGKYDL